MDIKKYIPKGHENAVSIDTLIAMTGMSNRQVRRAIAESDAIILNMQDGKGYFRMNPRTKAERAFAEKYSAYDKCNQSDKYIGNIINDFFHACFSVNLTVSESSS